MSPSTLTFILFRWFLHRSKTVREGSEYTVTYQVYLGVRLLHTLKKSVSYITIYIGSLTHHQSGPKVDFLSLHTLDHRQRFSVYCTNWKLINQLITVNEK